MSIESPIFAPAIVLVLWSLVMLAWLALTRLPAMSAAGISLPTIVGQRGVNLEGLIPDRVNWKSHNYTHLMEQPTLFYAVVVILALVEPNTTNAALAWSYTMLRIVHSVYQSLINRVPARLTIFMLATLALIALAIRALAACLAG